MRRERSAPRMGEAALRPDEHCGGAGMGGEGCGGWLAAQFVGEKQRAVRRPIGEQCGQPDRFVQPWKRGACALFSSFGDDIARPAGIELVGHAAPRDKRDSYWQV